ncbi:hypothetical protein FXO38_20821 [Capsicum annuum]|nr:hypothetical protein FXO37_33770 [Capsicum annuum]KAF3643005.1 hypothetical protein FXO38_20821 [Capsicum annuum]
MVPRAPPLHHGYVQKFIFKAIKNVGKQWYSKYMNVMYIPEVFIDRASLPRECPSMVRWIEQLNMNFIFYQPTECNLHLVHKFYAYWDPSDPDHKLKIHGKRHRVDEEELDYNPEIGPDSFKPVYNDIPTDEERWYKNSDMESNEEDQYDDRADEMVMMWMGPLMTRLP